VERILGKDASGLTAYFQWHTPRAPDAGYACWDRRGRRRGCVTAVLAEPEAGGRPVAALADSNDENE